MRWFTFPLLIGITLSAYPQSIVSGDQSELIRKLLARIDQLEGRVAQMEKALAVNGKTAADLQPEATTESPAASGHMSHAEHAITAETTPEGEAVYPSFK